jgi:hypothetical protein
MLKTRFYNAANASANGVLPSIKLNGRHTKDVHLFIDSFSRIRSPFTLPPFLGCVLGVHTQPSAQIIVGYILRLAANC